jgi:hypothetical protein
MRMIASGPVIPVFSRRLSMAADVASVQFSRTVERLYAGLPSICAGAISRSRLHRPRTGAGLSKLNSMPALFAACAPRGSK